MNGLQTYFEKYQKSNSNVTFFHWLEGDVQSISDLSRELGYSSIDELKKACKQMAKTK
jgi:hypothetical protein